MSFAAFSPQEISKIANIVSRRILVQVEGATCSGKTSFISDIHTVLRQKGIDIMIIDEAATKVFKENESFLKRLILYHPKSNQWKKTKLKLQEKVLSTQIDMLRQFAKSDFKLAIMDRGGASTAFHTIPLLAVQEDNSIGLICKKITKMARQVVMLSPLDSFQKTSNRYQKTLEEIVEEATGIKRYLEKWKINYFEIVSTERKTRNEIGVRQICSLIK